MAQYNESTVTRAVLDSLANCKDARFKAIMQSFISHLHAFVKEVDLTESEWSDAVKFLMDTGKSSTPNRNEFILLSDTLGVSMLVVSLAQARKSETLKGATEATEATVEGPFYWQGAPDVPLGADVSTGMPGEPALYCGRVTDIEGRPLAGALLDVWSGDGDGRYDVQLSDPPVMKGRGRLRTDSEGRYYFWSIKPTAYPVPDDLTTGVMLRRMGRKNWRPGHLHVMVSADRHVPLTTHLFVANSPHLDSDAVFAVRNSLIVDFEKQPPGKALDGRVMEKPYHVANYDFRLAPAKTA
ncbi:MAG: hydroxyquinol 1,2-dioxygenase [Burkholderiales bacterium]|nr:hydroxyquinol 1,2-dioxygenase [Burkholderiales bacterium]